MVATLSDDVGMTDIEIDFYGYHCMHVKTLLSGILFRLARSGCNDPRRQAMPLLKMLLNTCMS